MTNEAFTEVLGFRLFRKKRQIDKMTNPPNKVSFVPLIARTLFIGHKANHANENSAKA